MTAGHRARFAVPARGVWRRGPGTGPSIDSAAVAAPPVRSRDERGSPSGAVLTKPLCPLPSTDRASDGAGAVATEPATVRG